MSVMPTEKKRRWVSHKDTYRRVLQRNEVIVVDALEDGDNSSWKIGNAFLEQITRLPVSVVVTTRPRSEAATAISELSKAASLNPKDESDLVVLLDNGLSGSRVFEVKNDWSRTENAWNVMSGTSLASPADFGMAGFVMQSLASSGIWIDAEDASKQSEYFKKLRRVLAKSAVGYEQGWFRWKLRVPEQGVLPDETHIETASLSWIQSSEEILRRLENPDTNAVDRMTAVLFAETTAFESKDVSRLLTALAGFISKHRFSTDEEMTTAVGSAIRKYAMNMSEDLFEAYSEWLLPSSTDTLGHQLELELTKAFNWRLAYSPLTHQAVSVNVLRNFVDVCSSYLHRRIILQKNYASTVLHGLSAVAILEAMSGERERTDLLFKTATDMRLKWFSELLCDRLSETTGNIKEHSPDLAARISKNTSAYLSEHEGSGNARVDTVG